MMWKRIVRPLLFRLPPERAHYWSMGLFSAAICLPGVASWMSRRWTVADPRLESTHWGLRFRNPVGLA
ncbi:MAG TPA: quinone-dependent dihydroorotate dehydrogenase, partial [Pirellulaceae bacterium]|nr:quinone-dependent dihydroorotate dehydrogenase [Pirellulaceae bacterium]